ncbi:MAG TPA: Wzz/FepE/Etk N-terminal domain-containing protein [Thermomicrobiaceae bacterium]|nr:Wzz/FepE/Etk N-terminal domain-containing protein [Thermomicrobiaceae bacterium]
MELRAYLAVLARRWHLVVLVPALVLLAVIAQFISTKPAYTATAQVSVIRNEEQPELTDRYKYDGYYTLLASEYALDDLVKTVRGNVFAQDVSTRIRQDTGQDVPASEIQQAITSSRLNRILTLNATSSDSKRAVLIASEAAKTLEAKGLKYFQPNGPSSASIQTIDAPTQARANTLKRVLLYGLQLVVAVFAGLVLAYLVDYLDDTLRGAEAVSGALDLPVVGLIPDGGGPR